MKDSIKREQNDACINYAERENARAKLNVYEAAQRRRVTDAAMPRTVSAGEKYRICCQKDASAKISLSKLTTKIKGKATMAIRKFSTVETMAILPKTISLSLLIRIMQASRAAIAITVVKKAASLLREKPPKEKEFSMGSG